MINDYQDLAIDGVVTQSPVFTPAGGLQRLQVNPRGELRTAASLLPSTELVRQQQSFILVSDSVVTSVFATTLPSTTADHSFVNNAPAGGKAIVIEAIGFQCESAGGTPAATGLSALLHFNVAAPTSTTYGTVDTRNKSTNLYTMANTVDSDVIIGHGGTVVATPPWFTGGTLTADTVLTPPQGLGMWMTLPGSGCIVLSPQHQLDVAIFPTVDTHGAGAQPGFSITYVYHKVQLQ